MTVRWIDEPVTSVAGVRWLGALGDLGRPKNVHARTVLAAWNQSQNYIMAGYPTLDDILQETWMYRDRRMLGTFVIWWNNTANPPLANWGQSPLPPPAWFSNGVQESELTEQHLTALDTWATKSGSGLPTCIETCFAKAVGAPTQAQMQACLNQCTCPPGLVWDEPTQGCVQPPVPGPLPPPPATTPPATGPLPPAPPPIPAPTTASSTGTSSGVGLLIGGAIVLAAVAIFAVTVGGKGMSAAKANPRRRRRKNPRRRKTPMLVDIQCESPRGLREFRRIALGGTNPDQMYGRSAGAEGWWLPDTPEHMSERFHQLLRATGCHVVTIQGNPAPKSNPQPVIGYAYFYSGRDWARVSDEMWDTEVLGDRDVTGAKHVGTRIIDGERVNVWKLGPHAGAEGYVAQLVHLAR